MPIITCSARGQKVKVPDSSVGRQTRCPRCQATYPIAASPSGTAGRQIQPGPPVIHRGERLPVQVCYFLGR
jgi:hypothetical protein